MNNSILYIGNLLLPDGDAASHRVFGNAKVLRELGYQVSLLGCKEDVEDKLADTKIVHKGFDVYYFKTPNSIRRWFDYLFNCKWLYPLIDSIKPSIIILYNYPAVAMNKLIKYCYRKNIRIVSDCTEWFVTPGYRPDKILKRWDTSLRMKRYQFKMNGIIAISSFLDEYYSSKGVQTICVPPLIDKTETKWENAGYSPTDIRELVYVGNPGSGMKDKLDVVIAALENIINTFPSLKVHFSVIGITKDEYCLNFSPIPEKLCDVVTFMGRLPNAQSLDYIKKSDYTIFLREKNLVTMAGFPTKFSESITCGTPVLTNDSSDLAKYLVDGNNGFLIDTSSLKSICDTLYNALSVEKVQITKMKTYCLNDTSFDYHKFISVFEKMFPCQS